MNVGIPFADPAADPPFSRLVRRKKPGRHIWSPIQAAPFIDHSSLIWNFGYDRALGGCPCSQGKGEAMKKTLMALAAVATLAVSAVAVPAPAHAQRGVAAGVAAGLIGGPLGGGPIPSQDGYYFGP